MGAYEAMDKLCAVTTMLSDLAREQAAIIAQADIPDETKEILAKKRDAVDKELDVIEYGLRKVRWEHG